MAKVVKSAVLYFRSCSYLIPIFLDTGAVAHIAPTRENAPVAMTCFVKLAQDCEHIGRERDMM